MAKALIFDVDGTLAETEELHRAAFNMAFAQAGLGWTWSRDAYGQLLKTTGGKERIARYMQAAGVSGVDIAALHAAKTAAYTELVARGALTLMGGVSDLIARARASGLRLAIATTTTRANVEALALACFAAPCDAVFDVLACGDEVARKKPDPDVYHLALDRLGLPAADCIAFEDSRNGLLAAKAAGLRVVLTPSAYTADEDFSDADLVLKNLCAFDWSAVSAPKAGAA